MSTFTETSGWPTKLLWTGLAVLGAVSFAIVALNRGEAVNAAWLVVAAVCVYFIAYRFYGLFVASRALGVDPARPTPAQRHNDGHDSRFDLDEAALGPGAELFAQLAVDALFKLDGRS